MREVEAHLQRCESCRSMAELMKREAESRSDGEPQKIDYLKRIRRRNGRRVLLAAGAVLMTVLMVLLVLRYAVGERAGTDATCQIREEDGALTLLLGTSRDGRTLSTVSDSVQGDAFRPDSPELERMQRRMQSYAVLSLALTDNLGVFSWRFQQTDGTEVTQELTRAEADALLAALQGSGTQEPLQAHDFAAEPYLVQKLLELLEI